MSDPHKGAVTRGILEVLLQAPTSTSNLSDLYDVLCRTDRDLTTLSRSDRLNWARVHLCKLKRAKLVRVTIGVKPQGSAGRGAYKVWVITEAGTEFLQRAAA